MRGGRLLPKSVSIDSQVTYVGQGDIADYIDHDENQRLNINIFVPKNLGTNPSTERLSAGRNS